MGAPVVKVEVAFANNVNDSSLTWTDITAYVRGETPAVITRGRSDDMGTTPPGRMSITLDNTDGRFTVGNAASPYYPNVLSGKRIRLSVTPPAGGTSYRFTGFIDGWPTSWPRGSETQTICEITALDRMDRLSRAQLGSVVTEALKLDGPVAYWPLTEAAGAVSAGDISNGGNQSLAQGYWGAGGVVEFGGATGPGTDSASCVSFAPARTYASGTVTLGFGYLAAPLATPIVGASTGWTLHMSVRATWDTIQDSGGLSHTEDGSQAIALLTTAGDSGVEVGSSTSQSALRIRQPKDELGGPLPGDPTTMSSGLNDQRTHSLVVTYGSSTLTVYLDGVQVGTASPVNMPAITGIIVGGSTWRLWGFRGAIAHVALFDKVVSLARIQSWASAVTDGWTGETSSTRIGRYLDFAGVPASDRNLETGLLTCGHLDSTGQSVAGVMAQIADSEPGRLFVDGQGRVTFHNRQHRLGRAPTFTAPDAQTVGGDIRWEHDQTQLVNDVTASRSGGGSVRAVDAASVAAYGTYSESVTVTADSDTQVAYQAAWRATRNSTPTPRVKRVPVDLLTSPDSTVNGVLALDLGDTLALTGLPSQSPTTAPYLCVEGITEQIGVAEWSWEASTSPAAWPTTAWILEDATAGYIDSTFVLTDY